MAFYSPHGRGRIHHLAENDQDWVAHFYQIKGDEMCFETTTAFSLIEHVGHVPGEDPCTVSHKKPPALLTAWTALAGAESLTWFGGMSPAGLTQVCLCPLSWDLPGSRFQENPRSDPLWTMWQVTLVERMPTGVKGWVCTGGRVVPTWSDNCTTYFCSQAVLNQQRNQNM